MSVARTKSRPNRPPGLPPRQRDFWTRLYAETPSRVLPWGKQPPFPPLVQAVENGWLSPPGPVLDVGCGTGTNAIWLASRGYDVTGIDIAPGAIDIALSNRGTESRNPSFVQDDVLASALSSAEFHSAVDVGCFQTLPPRLRGAFSTSLANLLSPGAPFLVFWVAREETGAWGPPHRLSVGDVTDAFESLFLVERVEYRPRKVPLTSQVRRSARPLATLAGYTARLVRRSASQPRPR